MREPAFNGSFYPSNKVELSNMIDSYIINVADFVDKIGVYIIPHAGYVYSGITAGFAYANMKAGNFYKQADTVIILGPNHTGIGTDVSISKTDWSMPNGIFKTDKIFVDQIISNSKIIEVNEAAHMGEHSIEVQLPFIDKIGGIKKKFVFICMANSDINSCIDVSKSIIKSEESLSRKSIIIASSDFNHYENVKETKLKDKALFKNISNIDYESFNANVKKLNSSACGYGPITVAEYIAKKRGAKHGILLNYSNSANVTKDYDHLVSYASWKFE
jgi:hypothetical protein